MYLIIVFTFISIRSTEIIPVFNYVPNNMAPPLSVGQSANILIKIFNENKIYPSNLVIIIFIICYTHNELDLPTIMTFLILFIVTKNLFNFSRI